MRLLIIDEEESIRTATAKVLQALGHKTAWAGSRAEALRQLQTHRFDLAFLDLKLNGENGLEILPELLRLVPGLEVVILTACASVETAVEAMRRGAADYLSKPFTAEQIRRVLDRLWAARRGRGDLGRLESRLPDHSGPIELNSAEPAMQRVYEVAAKAAATPATILLLGESGTGKTIIARAIHSRNPQQNRAFVTVNCPSLTRELLESELFGHARGAFTGAVGDTEGKVALADGGTLFLDEIGELPLEIQPKLLRLLQEKEYERVGESRTHKASVRVISATNRDLRQAVREGRFREDLFYRLNVISILMPPLRQRPGDVQSIAENYLRLFSRQCGKQVHGFTTQAMEALQRYEWPGNLRELSNVIERTVILSSSDLIDLPDLPENFTAGIPAVS